MRRTPSTSIAVFALALAGALAACQAAQPIPTPTQAPVVSPTAAPTAAADVAAANVPPPGEPIPLGRYTMPDFLPRITFELEARGWFTYEASSGILFLSSANGISLIFLRPIGVYGIGSEPVAATTSAGAAEALGAIDDARVVGSSDSRMDGHTGKVVEVEYDEPCCESVAILQSPGEHLDVFLVPGRHLWVAFIDTPDGLLAIVADVETSTVDRDMGRIEPILESVTIGR